MLPWTTEMLADVSSTKVEKVLQHDLNTFSFYVNCLTFTTQTCFLYSDSAAVDLSIIIKVGAELSS